MKFFKIDCELMNLEKVNRIYLQDGELWFHFDNEQISRPFDEDELKNLELFTGTTIEEVIQ